MHFAESKEQYSAPHLAFLGEFSNPRSGDNFSERWDKELGESARRCFERFLSEGLIIRVNLPDLLDFSFKVTELKVMLKERGLPSTGRKEKLIGQLIEADADGMNAITLHVNLYRCTESGRAVLLKVREGRLRAQEQVLNALREAKLNEASELVSVFTGKPCPERSILENIFQHKPSDLAGLTNDQLHSLRIAAGMFYLWDQESRFEVKGVMPSFDTSLKMTNEVAAMMLIFHAFRLRGSRYFKTVEIFAIDDEATCQACRKLQDEWFTLDSVPVLPYGNCSSRLGCRCVLAAHH